MKHLLALWCCTLIWAGARAAPPALWVEASLDPVSVPINVQTNFVLRFGHAVDVTGAELLAPIARLAEIRPLGAVTEYEQLRDGMRYRVLERRFAVLPFASGDLPLSAEVIGKTPAAIPEAGPKGAIALRTAPITLHVTPASLRADAEWLPAHNLQISAVGAAPVSLAVGDVWTRQILIEAEGVDGSVIPELRWPLSADWALQSDGAEVGTREDAGRLIGFRRQSIRAQALRAGSLSFPALKVHWWRVSEGAWTVTRLPGQVVHVDAGAVIHSTSRPSAEPSPLAGWIPALSALVIVLLLAINRRALSSCAGQPTRLWRRWQSRRVLGVACRNADAEAARHALMDWAWASGFKGGTLSALAAWARRRGDVRLAAAVLDLERACYGRQDDRWDGARLSNAVSATFLL